MRQKTPYEERMERALEAANLEIHIIYGGDKYYGPPKPMKALSGSMDRSSFKSDSVIDGRCGCGADARDRRLQRKAGCIHCRNSLSDAFAEGW